MLEHVRDALDIEYPVPVEGHDGVIRLCIAEHGVPVGEEIVGLRLALKSQWLDELGNDAAGLA